MSKKILITGSEGFIGSHLTELLVKEGYNVKAFVQYNSFNSWGWLDTLDKKLFDSIEIYTGDVRQKEDVYNSMKNCNKVIHLAALIAIPYSYVSPNSYFQTNVLGTLNVLQCAKDLNFEKIIHTSTSEVYGSAKYLPIDEEHILQSQSPYSASKISADHLAMSFYFSFDLPVTILRPFNAYGPRQSARAVIPTMIIQILNNKEKILLGSINPKRDFNYVTDIASAFFKSINKENINGEVINVGNNFDISIKDTFFMIKELMNSNAVIAEDKIRIRPDKSEVTRLLALNEKAKQLLDWEPHFHGKKGLKEGLKRTIDWFKKPENIKNYKSDIYNL